MSKKVLLHYPSMDQMAANVQKIYNQQYAAGSTSELKIGVTNWDIFPDGWPNIDTPKAANLRGQDLIYIADLHDSKDVFENIAYITSLMERKARSLTVFIPFFPVATMERSASRTETVTARGLAVMLSALASVSQTRLEYVIFDPHVLQLEYYFRDVDVTIRTAMWMLEENLRKSSDHYAIVFPDEGSFKRYARYFPGSYFIRLGKERVGDEKIITVIEGDPHGRDCYMIDDLIQTGWTLIKSGRAVVARGARSVSAVAVHGVCPNNAHENFIREVFKNVWLTNTNPEIVERVRGMDPFQIFPIDVEVAKFIGRMA